MKKSLPKPHLLYAFRRTWFAMYDNSRMGVRHEDMITVSSEKPITTMPDGWGEIYGAVTYINEAIWQLQMGLRVPKTYEVMELKVYLSRGKSPVRVKGGQIFRVTMDPFGDITVSTENYSDFLGLCPDGWRDAGLPLPPKAGYFITVVAS